MGIARGMIKLLMREGKREKFFGSVLTLGRQDIYGTSKNLQKWAEEMNFQLKSGVKMTISNKMFFSEKGYITDSALFRSLGFDNIDSMDNNAFEQCTIIHDLNEDVSYKLHDKYDLIFDGGTSEHIFNFPKVLENCNKMLKVGGRVIHALPSSNHIDHGFYMFSPTLLYDYYSSNKWNIVDILFIKHSQKPDTKLWDIYKYVPGCLDRFSVGGLKSLYSTVLVAQKTENSTFNASIQQGNYLKTWNRTWNTSTEINNCYWERIVRRIPGNLKDIMRPFSQQIVSKLPLRFFLKLIARY